jgi:hypothetical protein
MLTSGRDTITLFLMVTIRNPRLARSRYSTARRIVLLLAGVLLASPAFAQDGIVEYVEGDAWITRGNEVFAADFGEPIMHLDHIETGPDGAVVVRLANQSQVKLRENSSIVIGQSGGGVDVQLQSGGVFARVVRAAAAAGGRPSFRITTPTVVAGVRGTEFFVAYGRTIEDEPDLWLCVNEGTVEVSIPSTGQMTLVEEGEGINILSGVRATDPRFYSWTTDLNWNFDPSQGTVADDTDLDGAYSDLLDQDYD